MNNFEWYIAVLVDLVKISEGVKTIGSEIGDELQNVAGRVPSVRSYTVASSAKLLLDREVFMRASLVLKAAAWIVGEYAIYLDNPHDILDCMLSVEPQTLGADTEAVYIQAIPKYTVVTRDHRLHRGQNCVRKNFYTLQSGLSSSWKNTLSRWILRFKRTFCRISRAVQACRAGHKRTGRKTSLPIWSHRY